MFGKSNEFKFQSTSVPSSGFTFEQVPIPSTSFVSPTKSSFISPTESSWTRPSASPTTVFGTSSFAQFGGSVSPARPSISPSTAFGGSTSSSSTTFPGSGFGASPLPSRPIYPESRSDISRGFIPKSMLNPHATLDSDLELYKSTLPSSGWYNQELMESFRRQNINPLGFYRARLSELTRELSPRTDEERIYFSKQFAPTITPMNPEYITTDTTFPKTFI